MVSLPVVKSFCLALTVAVRHVLTIAVTNRRVPDFRAVFEHRSGDPIVLLIALVFFSDPCTYLKGRA